MALVTLGTLGVYVFPDNGALERDERGFFVGEGAQVSQDAQILHKYVERSNVDMVEEMTSMMTSQRALQSAAQVLKMYDQIMSKAASDVGRL